MVPDGLGKGTVDGRGLGDGRAMCGAGGLGAHVAPVHVTQIGGFAAHATPAERARTLARMTVDGFKFFINPPTLDRLSGTYRSR
jgi:hypothetical protein